MSYLAAGGVFPDGDSFWQAVVPAMCFPEGISAGRVALCGVFSQIQSVTLIHPCHNHTSNIQQVWLSTANSYPFNAFRAYSPGFFNALTALKSSFSMDGPFHIEKNCAFLTFSTIPPWSKAVTSGLCYTQHSSIVLITSGKSRSRCLHLNLLSKLKWPSKDDSPPGRKSLKWLTAISECPLCTFVQLRHTSGN